MTNLYRNTVSYSFNYENKNDFSGLNTGLVRALDLL